MCAVIFFVVSYFGPWCGKNMRVWFGVFYSFGATHKLKQRRQTVRQIHYLQDQRFVCFVGKMDFYDNILILFEGI